MHLNNFIMLKFFYKEIYKKLRPLFSTLKSEKNDFKYVK
jgi:hypothetical protein